MNRLETWLKQPIISTRTSFTIARIVDRRICQCLGPFGDNDLAVIGRRCQLHHPPQLRDGPSRSSRASYETSLLEMQPHYPTPAIRIVVSCDAERYFAVDITGARDASNIRGRIFEKLNIPEDEQSHYSIFQSEIGTFGIGAALSDDMLIDLCRQYGDPSGSLKFFVSPYHDKPSVIYQPRRTPEGRRPIRRHV
ncbi:hypothetical protein PC9H_001812 [Pleurotus ostreatus]|uniref:Uncharacterized protein n=1 Tax=Pleurotus ostreatus TaxID=5322 RepID=A0A8H7DM14_PLEOS|nr:uncharacterized protein PC9H_001812 [Pleurotus ostreatus]KAF7419225.1 hypothetical protein PC9H_001812 [Pleurotus ostreatus]KAJ8690025.1 hypothetical protein PTI98_012870 [Pleurotus ostreatus]